MPSYPQDLTREAQKIWDALCPMIDKEIETRTRSAVRSRKMTVMTAPNGQTIGVAAPFEKTVDIPYSSALANVRVGDAVWVEWRYNNASTMIAMATGEGQILPDYGQITMPNRNLLAAATMIQSNITTSGELETPGAPLTTFDYNGIVCTPALIPVTGGASYRLSLYDDRAENITGVCRIAQYNKNGTFLNIVLNNMNWKQAQAQTFNLWADCAYIRLSVIAYPKYRWKLEKGSMTTAWEPSPQDIL